MNIVEGYPPNIEAINRVFLRPLVRVLYCYGDTIYNPGGIEVTSSLMEHEKVHSQRQGDQPGPWWHAYIHNPHFRIEEEVLAHMAEYAEILAQNPNRATRRRNLSHISHRLAGPMYGRLLSLDKARLAITTGVVPAPLVRGEPGMVEGVA